MSKLRLKQLLFVWIVPLVALGLFGRQIYLQTSHNLSVWKGGGMGMFAGIGAPHHRFLKISVVDPIGQTIVVVRFNAKHQGLMGRLRAEPSDTNFQNLANSLKTTRWKVLPQTLLETRADSAGRISPASRRRSLMIVPEPANATARGWQPAEVRIEFWAISYDRSTKALGASLERTFKLPSSESAN